MKTLVLTRPDDWHVHLRDGPAPAAVVPETARSFARAIIMPNLRPPVTKVAAALAYRERILAVVPRGVDFTLFMTLYLTDRTSVDDEPHQTSQTPHKYVEVLTSRSPFHDWAPPRHQKRATV